MKFLRRWQDLFTALAFLAMPAAQAADRVWASGDYESVRTCLPDSRPKHGGEFCLEILQLAYSSDLPKRGAALLIPGFFQNAMVFDLAPEQGISFARRLMKEKGLQIYFLHVRGIGNSERTRRYTLDDVAIDDIPRAIEEVFRIEGGPIFLVGHSQGGITAKAALSGLSRCGAKNCFSQEEADRRQAMVRGLLSIGANASMSTRHHRGDGLPAVGWLGEVLHPVTGTLMDYVHARKLLKPFLKGTRLSSLAIWDFLFSVKTLPIEVSHAMIQRTIDGSSMALINQFADGVAHGGVRASSGERYVDALNRIHVPVAEAVFGLDFFAPPQETYEDSFLRLRPEIRRFYEFEGQRHEDFMMVPGMQSQFSDAVDWLTASERKPVAIDAP